MKDVEVLIIGGGPAGLAAALGAHAAGCRDILILEREAQPGGILRQCIHNGFGLHTFKEELTGPEYARRYAERVRACGIPVRCGATALSLTADRVVSCVSREAGPEEFRARAIVLAMGCRERPRGSLGTPGSRCAGVYTAGAAQKMINLHGMLPGRRCVILGSGDIGLIMARRLTFMGVKVLACVELMPYSAGLKRNIVQCLNDFDIPLLLSHTVVDIRGRERLEGVCVARVDENLRPIPGSERDYACDTLLLSVGLIPENELTRMAGAEMSTATAGAAVDETLATSIPGIFACGNVLHVHDLVDFVSEEAQRAGENAARFAAGTLARGRTLPLRMGAGVGALVPQRISAAPAGPVSVMFRPRAVYTNARIRALINDTVVSEKKARILAPGEMARLTLTPEMLYSVPNAQAVEIRIEEEP